jgi:hypothetical protein
MTRTFFYPKATNQVTKYTKSHVNIILSHKLLAAFRVPLIGALDASPLNFAFPSVLLQSPGSLGPCSA